MAASCRFPTSTKRLAAGRDALDPQLTHARLESLAQADDQVAHLLATAPRFILLSPIVR